MRSGFERVLISIRRLGNRAGLRVMGAEIGRGIFHRLIVKGCRSGYTLAKVSVPRLLITDRVVP